MKLIYWLSSFIGPLKNEPSQGLIKLWRKIFFVKANQIAIKLIRDAAPKGVIFLGIVNTFNLHTRVCQLLTSLLCLGNRNGFIPRAVMQLDWRSDVAVVIRQ